MPFRNVLAAASGLAAVWLSGCAAGDAQIAYVDQQRQSCTAAGGYFEEGKIGDPDNYTCEGLPGDATAQTLPAPPTRCRTHTTTVTKDDGTEETRSKQVCSSL